jgi:PPOX class probable F420-dependent enzyme
MHDPRMATGSMLDDRDRVFLRQARTATLATTSPSGRPRLVPVCFVVGADGADGRPRLYSPLDDKPKQSDDPHDLARVRDLLVLPEASLLVDRWSEDWARLGWLRLEARAELLEPEPRERDEHAAAVAALREKYAQYRSHRLEERPILRFTVQRRIAWGDLGPDPG